MIGARKAAGSIRVMTATAPAEGFIEARDPRTGTRLDLVPVQGAGEVRDAVARARKASELWGGLSFGERADALLGVRDLLLDRLDEAAGIIVSETGKLETEALTTELLTVCETIQYYARHGEAQLRPERVATGMMAHKQAVRIFEPLGVVGVISPWNYPFLLAMTPIVTALFAGNAAVLKPSEVTSLTGRFIGELFADSDLPPGLVEVVTGAGPTGEALVRSGVDKICFTGSVRTGKRVMAAAAESLTPVLLELGGKDPMVVCADADLDRAAAAAVWGAFQNSGQTCVSVERVYAVDEIHDELVDRIVTRTAAIRQGQGGGKDIGSMTFAPQLATVEQHLADARQRGARIAAGGNRVAGSDGLWFEPTVVVDVDHSMELLREETFGPVLPIMRAANEDEAIRLANDSAFGLNSSVWTRDRVRGRALAQRIQAGNVCVNEVIVSYGMPALPFGGHKESGIGRVHGADGLREMSASKSILTDRGGLRREAWWFPTPRLLGPATKAAMQMRFRRGWRQKLRGAVASLR